MDLFSFLLDMLFIQFADFYERPVIMLLLAVYAVWDWRQTKAARLAGGAQGVLFGFRQATVAWIMKMVMTYFLFLLLYCNISVMFSIVKTLYSWMLDDFQPGPYFIQFMSQHVTLPVQALPTGLGRSANVVILEGAIEMEGATGYLMTVADLVIRFLYFSTFLFLLRQIFRSLSIQDPFTIDNVKRLRFLAVSMLVYRILQSGVRLYSSWYVKSHVVFETPETFQSRTISNDSLLVFISLLLLAEMIRYGARLKEDQDLTV